MDDKQKYMRWLEEMWDVHKFDLPGRTEREETRKEEVLEMLRGLSEIFEASYRSSVSSSLGAFTAVRREGA